jgi:sortase B
MRKHISRLFFLLGAALMIIAIVVYAPDIYEEYAGEADYESLRQAYTVEQDGAEEERKTEEESEYDTLAELYPCIEVDSEGLLEKNSDYIGWIYIPGTDVSYPVVQTDDNTYYLHRDIEKKKKYPGTIFMDCENLGASDPHSILYGHNMKNGSMFHEIKKYLDQEWANEHPVFWFVKKDGTKMLFKVFSAESVYHGTEEIYTIVTENSLEKAEQMESMVNYMVEKSAIDMGITPTSDDTIMTLSTCMPNNKYRCAVNGILVQ